MAIQLPIRDFIDKRLRELGIWKGELARRCGYKNISKGVRSINELCDGDLASKSSVEMLAALPAALEVEEGAVASNVAATLAVLGQAAWDDETIRRAAFKPSAYFLTERKCPSQIFICGVTGGPERYLRIPLDLSLPPETFAVQAHTVVEKTPDVSFFGDTTGYIVNYSADCSVRFDGNGRAIEYRNHDYSPGTITVFIGKTKLPSGGWILTRSATPLVP